MPEYRRTFIPGATYFFTVTTWHRQAVLLDESMRRALREAVLVVRQQWPFGIDAWVLLPDHLHCIWTMPSNDSDYSKRWGMIKRHVSKALGDRFRSSNELSESRRKRGESTLWQRRFWEHMIRDENDHRKHIDYVHWNPVKHGYVQRVIDWPYSTFHGYIERRYYPLDWGGGKTQNDPDEFGE